MSRTTRWLWIPAAVVALLVIGSVLSVAFLYRSGWIHTQIRNRVITEVEKATGGRAEVGQVEFDWRKMQARVSPFTLHGKEKPGEPVFVRAASIEVGLKIISAFNKDVNIASLIVDHPQVNIIVYPDGTTNLPSPVHRSGTPVAEKLLKIAARRFELRHGLANIRDEQIPFDIRGEDLMAAFDYDAKGPRYVGHLSSRQLHWSGRYIHPVAFDFDTDLVLDRDQLRIAKASFKSGRSVLHAAGSLQDLSFDANVSVAELANVVRLPIQSQGDAKVHGNAVLNWEHKFQYAANGQFTATGLAYKDSRVHVSGIGARGRFELGPDGVALPQLYATALGGSFEGRAELLDKFKRLRVEGVARNVGLADLTRVTSEPALAWSGVASGPVHIDGRIVSGRPQDFTIQTSMNLVPAPGGIPIQGNADLIYDQRAGSLRFGNSQISAGSSRASVTGTLGQSLRVSLETRNLKDLRPGLAMIDTLPLTLSGPASANVTVTGPLSSPLIAGHVTLGRFEAQGETFDSAASDVTLSASELTARNLELLQDGMRVTGSGRIQLRDWKAVDSSALSGTLHLKGGDVHKLLAKSVSGIASATAIVSGSWASPAVSVDVTVDKPTAYGETFGPLHAKAEASKTSVQVTDGDLRIGSGRVRFSGSYQRTGADWNTGSARFDLQGGGFTLDRFQHVREYKTGLSAMVTLKASGTAHLKNANFDLDSLDSQLTLAGMTRGTKPIGNISATARTRGDVLDAQVSGAIRGSAIGASGQWRLEGDYPGRAEVQFTPLTFAALQQMLAQGPVERELPFAGQLEGHAVIAGPLKKPDALQAAVTLPRIEMRANPAQRSSDLVLRNTEPVQLLATLKTVTIQSAKFAAENTSIEASGRVTFNAQSPWNAALKGNVNLAILRLFNSDITARGNAVLDTTVRGALSDPQVNGRLELKGASLYLADIPQGVDNANGVVTFDRNRANIEKLTAEVGGGRVGFGGFIGFGSGVLVYRVQSTADQVRFRHPDGASVTLNAALNLTGTSENGLVSGTITIMRAAFEPRADLGSLLAQSARPLPAPSAPNEYLRGLNFDVRIESGPSLEVQTSLTRDLEAEAELRLRGNAARPLLTGDISVSQGEIQFFGNKYSINRGDIRFINPSKIEPVFDIDLETKARGITVNISFSGTLNKLNLTYRSDPPLQTNDIVALLAVGRDPTTAAFANTQTRSNLLETGASTLGQAVAAPVSSRLQRFFGVSRLKIDPSLTGVENIPQARLTLEQQVSRDITLTYITNLTRTQEQIVRIQWDINRQWSAIAVREENGVFGIDFQYRKRFK